MKRVKSIQTHLFKSNNEEVICSKEEKIIQVKTLKHDKEAPQVIEKLKRANLREQV